MIWKSEKATITINKIYISAFVFNEIKANWSVFELKWQRTNEQKKRKKQKMLKRKTIIQCQMMPKNKFSFISYFFFFIRILYFIFITNFCTNKKVSMNRIKERTIKSINLIVCDGVIYVNFCWLRNEHVTV